MKKRATLLIFPFPHGAFKRGVKGVALLTADATTGRQIMSQFADWLAGCTIGCICRAAAAGKAVEAGLFGLELVRPAPAS